MLRISIPSRDEAPADSRPILDNVTRQLGFTPNLHRLMSISPAVLTGFVGLQQPLSRTLDRRTRDAIALVVSEVNGCHYCLAAHSYSASNFGKAPTDEIARNRQGESSDARTAAAARFAEKVVEARGHIGDADVAAVRDAGFSDAEILEIVALSVQFSLTNYMNNVAGTDIDFPSIESV